MCLRTRIHQGPSWPVYVSGSLCSEETLMESQVRILTSHQSLSRNYLGEPQINGDFDVYSESNTHEKSVCIRVFIRVPPGRSMLTSHQSLTRNYLAEPQINVDSDVYSE